MTKEQLVDVKNVVAKAENLIADIDETKIRLDKVIELRNTKGGVDDIITKDFTYIINNIFGEPLSFREPLTEEKEKFLDACIEILTSRVERLEGMLAELPTYHSKADCLKEMVEENMIVD